MDNWSAVQEAWYTVPKTKCQKLVESMGRRCEAVIQNKAYSTKLNGRAFVHTKKSTNAILKGLF